jgi:hypothetical protein
MKTMPFPESYIQRLKDRTKCCTFRMNEELGRYATGQVYAAVGYSFGNDLEVSVRVTKVSRYRGLAEALHGESLELCHLDRVHLSLSAHTFPVNNTGEIEVIWFEPVNYAGVSKA